MLNDDTAAINELLKELHEDTSRHHHFSVASLAGRRALQGQPLWTRGPGEHQELQQGGDLIS